tara:strand:- start:398 stop:598 length:201 start_codon:yes stop_codon:yes gene_type:complete
MTNILDLIASDSSSNEISDAIKDALYAKSSEKIDSLKPSISSSIFDEPEIEDETTVEPEEETQEDG